MIEHNHQASKTVFNTYYKNSWFYICIFLIWFCFIAFIVIQYIYYLSFGDFWLIPEANITKHIRSSYFLLYFALDIFPFVCLFLPVIWVKKYVWLFKWVYLPLFIWSIFNLSVPFWMSFTIASSLYNRLTTVSDV